MTFPDGQVLKVTGGIAGALSAGGIRFNGAEYCVNSGNFAQVATVSGTSFAPYNGAWYVIPLAQQNHGNNGNNPCSWTLDMRPLAKSQSGSGGNAALITDNYYQPGVSMVSAPAVTADLVAANIMYAAEKGAAGVRVYVFGDDANSS